MYRNQHQRPSRSQSQTTTDSLWERRCDDSTCSRKRYVRQYLRRLTHRFREQARSHMGSALPYRSDTGQQSKVDQRFSYRFMSSTPSSTGSVSWRYRLRSWK
ncbi:hypothetical protein EYC95_17820 [Pseudomonas sp. BGI-2]|nr:hypothetical protein EYC95_17820 [Pseudomonas sp. BGI-2]